MIGSIDTSEVLQRHFDAAADAPAVDVVHGVCLNSIIAEDLFLGDVDVPETDVDEPSRLDAPPGSAAVRKLKFLQPVKYRMAGNARQKRARHPVNIPRPGGCRGVNIRVSIDPNNVHSLPRTFLDCFRSAGDAADGDAVVAAEGECQTTVLGVRVDLLGEFVGDGGDGEGAEHAVDGGVALGHEGGVFVYDPVVVQRVAEGYAEVFEKVAVFDEAVGGGFDAGFSLGSEVSMGLMEIVMGRNDVNVLDPRRSPRLRSQGCPQWGGREG